MAEQRLRQGWPLVVVCHAGQGGTDDQRYKQVEGNREHEHQRKETLPDALPEISTHTIDSFRLDFTHKVQSGLQLAKDRCGTDSQSHDADNGRQHAALRLGGGEDDIHQLSARRAYEELDLLLELVSDLLSLRDQPRYTDDNDHQRRQ